MINRDDITSSLFRPEAVDQYLRDSSGKGILIVSPPWSWLILWTLGAIIITAFVFSFFGEVEVNELGKGIIRPVSGVRLVITQVPGLITEVAVNSGDFVKEGSLLLRMDSTQIQANQLEAEQNFKMFQNHDYQRVIMLNEKLYVRQTEDLRKKIIKLKEDIESSKKTVQFQSRRVNANRHLFQNGIVSDLEVANSEEQKENAERQLRDAQQTLALAEQDHLTLEAQYQQQSWSRNRELNEVKVKVDSMGYPIRQTLLVAPSSGFVDALVTRPGDFIQAGQLAAKIISTDAPLQAVVFLPEMNRAFVKEGDSVKIELNQFPFTEFGTIGGTVVRIGNDLASPSELREAFGEGEPLKDPSFRIEVQLATPQKISPAGEIKLRPGMLANVRFTLRRQKLITYAIEPLKRWLN